MDFGNEINKFYPDHFPVPYIRLSQLRFKIKMMFPQFSFDCTNEWNTSTITRTKICIWYVLTFNMYECLHYYDNNQCLFDKYCNPTWLFCDLGNSVYHVSLMTVSLLCNLSSKLPLLFSGGKTARRN